MPSREQGSPSPSSRPPPSVGEATPPPASLAAAYIRSYADRVEGTAFAGPAVVAAGLLGALQLERALRELRYELVHRPFSARLPLRGILGLLADVQQVSRSKRKGGSDGLAAWRASRFI